MSALRSLAKLKSLWIALAIGLGQFAPGILTAASNSIFGASIGDSDEMGAIIWHWASSYPLQHPDRALWLTAILLLLAAVHGHGWPFLKRQWGRRLVLQKIGIRAYMHRSDDPSRKKSWDDCVRHLTRNNDVIFLAGANGWDTFGDVNSPLHKVFLDFEGTINVLLIHPSSLFLETRCNSVREKVANYKVNLKRSLFFLKQLKGQGKNVEVRLFDQPPGWKMIFSHNMLWLQHYEDGKSVEFTPAYGFERHPKPGSLYYPFRVEFQRMWDRSEKISLSGTNGDLTKRLGGLPQGYCDDCVGANYRLRQSAAHADEHDLVGL